VFERYTESARRALFFARYELSERGGRVIDTPHLLLGLTRESRWPLEAVLAKFQTSADELQRETAARCVTAVEKVPASQEIPFSPEMKRVLLFAAEEADRLLHDDIGPEHLLLGLLREERSTAASILIAHGLRIDAARTTLVQLLNEPPGREMVRDAATQKLAHLSRAIEDLARTLSNDSTGAEIVRRIATEADALKRHLTVDA
jgi:ATP-dependent Clp protease ATP-binding subunit ClpC